MHPKQTGFLILFLLASLLAAFGVWRWSYGVALVQLENRASASLSLASDHLVGLLERYRILPVALSSDVLFVETLARGTANPKIVNRLQSLADMTGAQNISLVDQNGNIIATSRRLEGQTAAASSIANRPDFRRAMNGALGIYHAQENPDSPRGFMFSSAVRAPNGQILGTLTITTDLEALEFHWRGDPEIIFFTDQNDVIFIANRDNLILRVLGNPSETRVSELKASRYKSPLLQMLNDPDRSIILGQTIWNLTGMPGIPTPALHITQPLPVISMQANILLDLAPVAAQARLRAFLALAIFAGFGLILRILQIRRQSLSTQLFLRNEANEKLEGRVQERTKQLTQANKSLQIAQDDLVQSEKLAALGKMSASISHELNQPLTAIRSFSENASEFAKRGQITQTKANLERISDLTTRMARIIKNLRAFARKEGEETTDVLLTGVVDAALEIAATRIRNEKVDIIWLPKNRDIWVRGGAVRLQQVVLNLLSNAMDAMDGMAQKSITITALKTNETTSLMVHDTGPGLESTDNIFDPFYTTKGVDQPSGMGLGLSISYGIVQSFGGRIIGKNHPDKGAVFTVTLDNSAKGTAS